MKKIFFGFTIIVALASFSWAQGTQKSPTSTLKVGDAAPDFELTDTFGNKVKLSEYKGKKNVVLAFFVLAFTGG